MFIISIFDEFLLKINGHLASSSDNLKQELSSNGQLSRSSLTSLAALIYVVSLSGLLAKLFGISLPYAYLQTELCLCNNRITEDSYHCILFKLKYSILNLCSILGVSYDKLKFNEPLGNIYRLASQVKSFQVICTLLTAINRQI